MMAGHREQLILLNLIPGVTSVQWTRLLEAFESPEHLARATVQELQQVQGIGPAAAQRITQGCRDRQALERELVLADRAGVAIVTLADAGYPEPLRQIPDPPLAVYIKGSLSPSDGIAVGVVGSRHPSAYGLQTAERLGHDLARHGVTVVSGLARGIDGAAHRGALKAAGRTVAVLGNGLSGIYPPEHRELAEQVMQQGAVLSEYPMAAEALPAHFPRRNRLISGLSLGVIVVEAAQRSGALITADCALDQNREVFAVPGPISAQTSLGTNTLLKQGARLVTSVEDVLEELQLVPQVMPVRGVAEHAPDDAPDDAPDNALGALPRREQQILACLQTTEPRYIDAIAEAAGVPVAEVSSVLLQLELKRIIRQLPGQQFLRSMP